VLRDILKREAIELGNHTIERLEQFAITLHEWNSVHNLTGAKSIKAIYDNILDSLYPLSFIEEPKSMLDVGTGAGFPGLVLAMSMPNTEVVLAEPLKKRAAFLRYVAIDLELTNVLVEAKRVEELSHSPFDLITSRAVTNTELLLKLTQQVSSPSSAYLFYKGERVFDEIEDVQHQLSYDIVQKNRRNYLYIKTKEL
jgi:16S rRNA (guanine527-N7)-methyltransferase